MAIRSGMFMSVGGDRKYKAYHFAEYFASFIGNGVFPVPSTGFQVIENANMKIAVKDGKAWINGYYAINEGSVIITLANADGVLNRIDRVVLRYDTKNRIIDTVLKQGTFATNPVAPTLQRDADAYEIALADVYIGKGATTITQANITDQRLNKDLCGIVHGVVDQVDTTTLFNQYQAFFNEYSTKKTAEFEAWVASLQDVLSGDVAGNLLNLISTSTKTLIRQKFNVLLSKTSWTYDGISTYKYRINNADITSDSIVDINVRYSDLLKASSIVACESFSGYVIVYSTAPLGYDITVDYRITREVNV